MSEIKEFSVSPNGDRWCLDMSAGEAVVLHMGNEPSGGHETRTPLADFLKEREGKPEHAALLQVLGQSRDEVEHQLGGEEAETTSHRTAMEYLRLGGRRLAKVDDNIVSTRAWEDEPPVASAFWNARVESLDEKSQREVMLHLPSISDPTIEHRRTVMSDDLKDLGSDASRTDPETADRAREELENQARRGIERATAGDSSAGPDDHPEQDPAEGSRETVERDLARKDKDGWPEAESVTADPAKKVSSPGSEAAEPSPER